ncbi:hypothetical protein [Novosphingobium soli]|uniref:Lipoprotein n=1 Tax=Novosphingobium soli TaxID=574956 RepID=A0ABV6CYU9_9SPHN
MMTAARPLAPPLARPLAVALAASLALAGCGSGGKQPAGESDPALDGGLGDPVLVDPQGGSDQRAIAVPPQDRTPEAVAAARRQAAESAGGTLQPPPAAAQGGAGALAEAAAKTAQVAPATRAAGTDCAAKVRYSGEWVARIPAELPVYPRAAVQEAAGIDGDGCALRVVSFATPVSVDDVIGFYYGKATAAGYTAEHKLDGSDHVLGGRRQARAYVVYARKLEGGLTEVDLVASGK